MAEKLLTVREVSHILGISEKEVIQLSELGKIPAYKIGGVYLRFKREQIEQLKNEFNLKADSQDQPKVYPLLERISDFIYFNDFYIAAAIIIFILIAIILKGTKG
jgi:excisionase family DNA binding protein